MVIEGASQVVIKMLALKIAVSQQVFLIFFACMVLSMFVLIRFCNERSQLCSSSELVLLSVWNFGGFFSEKIPSFLGYSKTLFCEIK